MGRTRGKQQRKLQIQSGHASDLDSRKYSARGTFSNLSDAEKELLAYHEFVITKKNPKTTRPKSIALFETSVIDHIRQVCAVKWTLTTIQRKLKFFLQPPFSKNANADLHGALRLSRLPNELQAWIEGRILELSRHAFMVAKSDGVATERLTRSESLALGTAAPQHMSLSPCSDLPRRPRISSEARHNIIHVREVVKVESPTRGRTCSSSHDSQPSNRFGQLNEGLVREHSIISTTSGHVPGEDAGIKNSPQDVTVMETWQDAVPRVQEASREDFEHVSSRPPTTASIGIGDAVDEMLLDYKSPDIVLGLMRIRREHDADTAVLLNKINTLEKRLAQEIQEKENHEFFCDMEKTSSSMHETILAKNKDIRLLETEIEFQRKQISFYNATDGQVMNRVRQNLQKAARDLKLQLDRLLDRIKLHRVESLTKCVVNETLIQLAAACFGPTDSVRPFASLEKYLCEPVALISLTRALLSNALIMWIFFKPIPRIEGQSSVLLTKYRELILKQNGRNSLRCIDYIAHSELLNDEGDLSSLRISGKLTSKFMAALRPLFQDYTRWMEQEESINLVFQAALDLKAQAVMSSYVLKAIVFKPGEPFEDGIMDDRSPRMGTAAHQKVALCTSPAILVYDDDKDLVDTRSFKQMDVRSENKTRCDETLVKASIILDTSTPDASFVADSEAEV